MGCCGSNNHGSAIEALKVFHRMIQYGCGLDNGTFHGVLVACRHSGIVDEGLNYIISMNRLELDTKGRTLCLHD